MAGFLLVYIQSVSETGHRYTSKCRLMNVGQLLAKCEGICSSAIYFHFLLPIITSERDRDTHRSLFMSNMHFELRNGGGGGPCQRNEQF
jgi:hypothetical protein